MTVIICHFFYILCNLSHESTHDSIPLKGASLAVQTVSIHQNYISPCPKVFRYIFNGDEWQGLLHVKKTAPRGLPSFLRIQMTIGFNYSSVSYLKEL